MSQDEFSLPGSSLEEIEKIIDAYADKGDAASNDEIGRLAAMGKTQVSRNNGFLLSLGLIEKVGRNKQVTELGAKLGRAIHHGQKDDIRRFWQQAVAGNSFLSEQLTAVRIQKGIKVDDLPGKILYNSGETKNKATRAGANAVVDLLVRSGLLREADGKYEIAKEPASLMPDDEPAEEEEKEEEVGEASKAEREDTTDQQEPQDDREEEIPAGETRHLRKVGEQPFALAVNLQLQLPEFEDTKKYEDLFRALRKHLIEPGDDEEEE